MWSKIFLSIAFILATWMTAICVRSPNPVPKIRHPSDRIFRIPVLGNDTPKVGGFLMLLLSLSHVLIIATSTTPQSPPSTLCPNPSHLNMTYFIWSPYVVTCLALIFVFGFLRLQAYNTLGKNFTFELAKPTGLVTTGIYSYVQHPSYLPLIVIMTVNMALFMNVDGALGCRLPLWIIEPVNRMKWIGLTAWLGLWVLTIKARVRDEEEMLRQTFGREWEEWHARTARFIPGVF